MTTENHEPTQDIVNRATEALRNSPVPAGPTDDLVRATLTKLESPQPMLEAERLQERRRLMFRIARYGGLAAAAAVLGAALCSLWLMDRTASPAFAQVVANVRKATSVTFRCTQKLTPHSPTLVQKWYLQGEHMRLELLGNQGNAHGKPPVLAAIVADYKEKEALELDFVRKTARKLSFGKDMPGNFNPIESLRSAREEDATDAGTEKLDGRKTRVYRLTRLHVLGMRGPVKPGETAKIWVDPGSGLPVRMVIETFTANHKGKSSLVFDAFTWNKPLAASLFKLTVPKGFTLKKK